MILQMSNLKISPYIYCIHSNHLFRHPLCNEQSLLKRIANVVFHIFTLGIPLAIYRCKFPKTASKKEHLNLQNVGILSVQQTLDAKPYTSLGKEALDFARKKLEKHPEIFPAEFAAGWHGPKHTHQPINQEIAKLATLFNDVIFKKFKELIKEHNENAWNHQEVIEAADACMKIGFAVSNLTLDDLEVSTYDLSLKGKKRTYAKALTEQDSYQYRTFFYCTNAYHWLRGAVGWGINIYGEEGFNYTKKSISSSHATLFYKKGTIQNSWNRLYNEYCKRVRLHVNENELKDADTRHYRWTKSDVGVKSFSRVPDTQPT